MSRQAKSKNAVQRKARNLAETPLRKRAACVKAAPVEDVPPAKRRGRPPKHVVEARLAEKAAEMARLEAAEARKAEAAPVVPVAPKATPAVPKATAPAKETAPVSAAVAPELAAAVVGLVEQWRELAGRLAEGHDHASTKRTRFDTLQSFAKADRFLVKALTCYLADGARESLDAAAPWDGLFARFTNRGKREQADAE